MKAPYSEQSAFKASLWLLHNSLLGLEHRLAKLESAQKEQSMDLFLRWTSAPVAFQVVTRTSATATTVFVDHEYLSLLPFCLQDRHHDFIVEQAVATAGRSQAPLYHKPGVGIGFYAAQIRFGNREHNAIEPVHSKA